MKKFLKYLKRVGIVIGVTLVMLVIGLYAIMWICVNGPSPLAGDLFVLSVRETSAGGFLANIYCSQEKIAQIEERNKVQSSDEITDTSIIKIPLAGDEDDEDDDSGELKENEIAPGIIVEDVSGTTYKGKMMIIKDPSRIFVGILDEYGINAKGYTMPEYIDYYDAAGGINAGGFWDGGGSGGGGLPEGIVISEGELRYGELNKEYEIIGFTDENIFVVGDMTAQKALEMGVRDAVSFGPILIVNGVPNDVSGTGGGLNPRTAIGQRADGAVLFLVIDGRQASSLGASMNDLINIMLEYEAVNAANLDGGSSSVLYWGDELLTVNSSLVGLRRMPNAFLIKKLEK